MPTTVHGLRGQFYVRHRAPLPCWWSWVVRGWASCCGHDVLPLSLDDPGAKVTCSSRALVTADKGNGPQCVRSNAYVSAGPVVHRLAPYQLDREAAGEMDIGDIEVFIGIDVGKSEHWGHCPEPGRAEGPRQGPTQRRGPAA